MSKAKTVKRTDNIENMDFEQLRKAVQLLRDELAIMKRKYDDIIYNLDDDNFSGRLVKEKRDMKTAIDVNAEGIKTKVSKEDLDNSLSDYSTISQTASMINTTVTKEYVVDKLGDAYVTNAVLSSEIKQTADEIYLSVSREYETKVDAEDAYNDLSGSISSVSVTTSGIETRVENLETFKTSTFTQTADGFLLDGEKTGFTGYIYLTDNSGEKRFTFFHDTSQGYEQVIMHRCVNDYIPIVIGDNDGDVYLGLYSDGNQVATRKWVKDNAGSGSGGTAIAVFG